MRIALHTPLKPLSSEVPSGDLAMARLMVRALGDLGHETVSATSVVSWAPAPDDARDASLRAEAQTEIARLLAPQAPHFDLWLTYHNYHKAPDLIGPAVSAGRRIPYAIVEASRAAKRAAGPWAMRFALADAALAAADAVAAMHEDDREGLAAVVEAVRLHTLPPFIDAGPFAAVPRSDAAGGPVRLIAVGMMRPGDKVASYRVLADALGRLGDRSWHLTVVGDGPARDEVRALFPPDRVRFAGAVLPATLPALYGAADIKVWPAINEAYGLVLLEAQAAGVPVVAGDRDGVAAIVRTGETGLLAAEGDAAGFAAALATLIDDGALRRRMGEAARRHVLARHDLAAGRAGLAVLLAGAAAVHGERTARAEQRP